MTITEILPKIQQLPDTDKVRLIEMLIADLSGRTQNELDVPTEPLPIWSPSDSYQAAADLLAFARNNKSVS